MEEVQSVQTIIESLPNIGLIGVAVVANLFPGIPEEVLLLVVGYLIGTGSLVFWKAFVFLFVGFFVMDSVLFALARKGTKFLSKLQEKLLGGDIADHQDFIRKHSSKIIFFSRFALYIRWIGPVLSGSVRTPWKKFLLVDAIALGVYVPTMLLIGIYFRGRIQKVIEGVNAFGNIMVIVFLFAVLVLIVWWGRSKFKQKLVATTHGENPKRSFLGFSWKTKK